MSYRNYIGQLPKNYIYNREDDSHPRDIKGFKNIYELGKQCDFDTYEYSTKFENFENNDEEFIIVNKEFLLSLIDEYRKNVVNYYTKLSNNEIVRKTKEDHIQDRIVKWSSLLKPYDLSDKEHITDSWEYEYSVFELVRIYKTFDWDNYLLIYLGY